MQTFTIQTASLFISDHSTYQWNQLGVGACRSLTVSAAALLASPSNFNTGTRESFRLMKFLLQGASFNWFNN